jgi:hypothetical protein
MPASIAYETPGRHAPTPHCALHGQLMDKGPHQAAGEGAESRPGLNSQPAAGLSGAVHPKLLAILHTWALRKMGTG